MPDKTPHRDEHKKPTKTIKQRRAEKRTKGAPGSPVDPVAHIKKR
jgi:hypothetical protein